jgi:hypothetical protein
VQATYLKANTGAVSPNRELTFAPRLKFFCRVLFWKATAELVHRRHFDLKNL